jgi:hypothetical protein
MTGTIYNPGQGRGCFDEQHMWTRPLFFTSTLARRSRCIRPLSSIASATMPKTLQFQDIQVPNPGFG